MAKRRSRRDRPVLASLEPAEAATPPKRAAAARRSTTRLAIAGAAAVVAVLAAASAWYALRGRSPAPGAPANAPPVSAAAPQRRDISNVILISMDTTRWDAISAYGAPDVNSPNVGALAREGVVFENAYAPMPVTLPSHASMLTGKVPLAHGVFDNSRYRLSAEHQTLAEVLRGHGFNTAAFVSALVLDSRFGLDRGFELYDDEIAAKALMGERRGDLTTARAIDWLERHAGERNFLFLHLFDPHAPYEAPEPFASRIRGLYGKYPAFIQDYVGEVAFADHCIGQLVATLKQLGVYDRTLICVTADHGESHGEHGENTHAYFIYTSTMKVPFILKVPGTPGPMRVRESVEITDIPTTLLSLLGLGFENEVQGHDLAGYLRGTASLFPDRAIVGISLEPRKYGGSSLLGVIVGDRHYIQAPRPELYDLVRDVYERENLVEREVDTARKLRERLEGILGRPEVRALPQRLSVDAETQALLESLGYVVADDAPGDLDSGAGALDPKDLIEYYRAALTAMSYVAPENRAKALAAAEEMVAMRPEFYFGYLMKARILEASGRHAEAVAMLEKARTLAPASQELTLHWAEAASPDPERPVGPALRTGFVEPAGTGKRARSPHHKEANRTLWRGHPARALSSPEHCSECRWDAPQRRSSLSYSRLLPTAHRLSPIACLSSS